MTKHISVRVAWHDNLWNGSVCSEPVNNTYCSQLDRIRGEKDEAAELRVAGRDFTDITDQLPPCKAENGAFMNQKEWMRTFVHPYAHNAKCASTHGDLQPRKVAVPPYSCFAVPFFWMLNSNKKVLASKCRDELPDDETAPFTSPWVFGKVRQRRILEELYGAGIQNGKSVVAFYTKQGQPLGDKYARLIVGLGLVEHFSPVISYNTNSGEEGYPLWDRLLTHTIRHDLKNGFLLPYHEYLRPTGDAVEDARRTQLLDEIALYPESENILAFSYGSELFEADTLLSLLLRALHSVRKIREHGIASGDWSFAEKWLNAQIAQAWQDRGAFPGLGPGLEAIGFSKGTIFIHELRAQGILNDDLNPFSVLDEIFAGIKKLTGNYFEEDIKNSAPVWQSIRKSAHRAALFDLLSRFDLTQPQFTKWFDEAKRKKFLRKELPDSELIANPYVITELELSGVTTPGITFQQVDRGLMPEDRLRNRFPAPEPTGAVSENDPRRIRAAVIQVLKRAAAEGDTALIIDEVFQKLETFRSEHPFTISADWLKANAGFLADVIETGVITQEGNKSDIIYLQLAALAASEAFVKKIVLARAKATCPVPSVNWQTLLDKILAANGIKLDPANESHQRARVDQINALNAILGRKLTVLTGKAGTGKTTVMGALLAAPEIKQEGYLLLAPTGKARVRLGTVVGEDQAQTVAQFLNKLGRYDGNYQRPLLEGKSQYATAATVIVDEASMLTIETFHAILKALDLAHVKRIILVGDPSQLPPIGPGKPFADIVYHAESDSALKPMLYRLKEIVRGASNGGNEALTLADLFTGDANPVSEVVLNDLMAGSQFPDLRAAVWRDAKDVRAHILAILQEEFGLESSTDVNGFNRAIGIGEQNRVDPRLVDNFQILSPVRVGPQGTVELNRWLQSHFRKKELADAANYRAPSLGDENIVFRDKVIQLTNEEMEGYNFETKEKVSQYVANGETGIASHYIKDFLNIKFSSKPEYSFGYSKYDFRGGSGPIELAYAITVHKSQGSEFGTVFCIIPANAWNVSRELIYTAITRAKKKLVLLVEGNNLAQLFEYSKVERSALAKRNSLLFNKAIRLSKERPYYAEYLIHLAKDGTLLRSKSEVIIANELITIGLKFEYERPVSRGGTTYHPDFSFVTDAGELIIWEHLGMLNNPNYREKWNRKKEWYNSQGFTPDETLFVTEDEHHQVNGDTISVLNSAVVQKIAQRIKAKI